MGYAFYHVRTGISRFTTPKPLTLTVRWSVNTTMPVNNCTAGADAALAADADGVLHMSLTAATVNYMALAFAVGEGHMAPADAVIGLLYNSTWSAKQYFVAVSITTVCKLTVLFNPLTSWRS